MFSVEARHNMYATNEMLCALCIWHQVAHTPTSKFSFGAQAVDQAATGSMPAASLLSRGGKENVTTRRGVYSFYLYK